MSNAFSQLEQLNAQLTTLRSLARPSVELLDVLMELCWHHKDDLQQLTEICQELSELAITLDSPKGKAYSNCYWSFVTILAGRYDQALTQEREALVVAQQLQDMQLEAHVRRALAITHRLMGSFSEALEEGLVSIKCYQQAGDYRGEGEAYMEIGIVYGDLGNLDQALTFSYQALEIYREIGYSESAALSLNNIAYWYLLKHDYQQARSMAEESLHLCESLPPRPAQHKPYAYALDSLALIWYHLGDLNEAFRHAQLAHTENRYADGSVRYADLEPYILLNLGRIYRQRSMLDPAVATFEAAISYCSERGLKLNHSLAHQELSDLWAAEGQFEVALTHYKRFHELERDLFNEQSDRNLSQLRVLHETETAWRMAEVYQEKNATLERLLVENEQQRNTIHELSIPVLPISSDILVIPRIGAFDSMRLRQLQERALGAVQFTSAQALLLDITGVPIVDTQVAKGIIGTMQAARLLGVEVVLVGIRPEVAQSIVGLGLDLRGIRTTTNLQGALKMLGVLRELGRSFEYASNPLHNL